MCFTCLPCLGASALAGYKVRLQRRRAGSSSALHYRGGVAVGGWQFSFPPFLCRLLGLQSAALYSSTRMLRCLAFMVHHPRRAGYSHLQLLPASAPPHVFCNAWLPTRLPAQPACLLVGWLAGLPDRCAHLPRRHSTSLLPAACCLWQVNKTLDKAFSSSKPQEPVEPAFVTDAKLRWNVSLPSCLPACPTTDELVSWSLREARGMKRGAGRVVRQQLTLTACAARHGMGARLAPLPPHSTPLPVPSPTRFGPRVQLTKWKPGEGAQQQQTAEQQRPKRADRYSSREKESKQRLAELVDQHKAGRSQQAPRQQTARR